jgi:hypothetical protein
MFSLYVGMAPFKPLPNFKFCLLFSRSMSIIPNPCQFNTEIKCPSSDVNPTPTLFVSYNPKGKVVLVSKGTPTHEPTFVDVLSNSRPNKLKKRAKKSKWELNKIYQDKWATRFSWFEAICGKDGKMNMVRCKIYNDIKGKDKLLVSKLDSLIKHFGLRTCTLV